MPARLRIYLDTSVLNRPFDEQGQAEVHLETESFFVILQKIVENKIVMLGSSVLDYENSINPFSERRERVVSYLNLAREHIGLSDTIALSAVNLERLGFGSIDAVHLACAEEADADFFITCDKALIRKAERHSRLVNTLVMNPMTFVSEVLLNV